MITPLLIISLIIGLYFCWSIYGWYPFSHVFLDLFFGALIAYGVGYLISYQFEWLIEPLF